MAPVKSFVSLLAASAAAGVYAAPTTIEASEQSARLMARQTCLTDVPGAGLFNTHIAVDFTSSSLPSSLVVSTNTIGAGSWAPYSRQFRKRNVVVRPNEPMRMYVPGGQTSSPILSAQVTTAYDDVLYASVKTVARVSNVRGTVHGFFMYKDDWQETDIEFRTGDLSVVHYTNQRTMPGQPETTYPVAAPADAATTFHEYRYDWLADRVDFYLDGVLQKTIMENVPSAPGWLMWNNWSNGNDWCMGLPATDSVLEIRSIDAWFNRTSVVC